MMSLDDALILASIGVTYLDQRLSIGVFAA